MLVVDQCEEVFSLSPDEASRAAFLAGLVRWSEQGRLVVAMRADRLAEASAYPAFARLLERSLYLLGAMTEDGLRAAVEAPARQSGLLIEPGLVDVLVSEVAGTAGALPLMSHALLETWKRREANTLTVEGYTASGGIRGAVAKSAEAVYAGIGPEQRVVLRDLVLRLVSSGTQGEPVRARLPRRLFSAEPDHQQLIDLLVGSRLVTSDAGVVEIAHEALARAWPRLRTWLDEDMEGQRIRQHLTAAADGWDTLGRPDSELYRGVRLTQALQWRERADTRLTATEIAFLDVSERAEQSERRAEQVRARAQGRLIRRLRVVLAVAVVLLVVALSAGLVAFEQQDRAEENAAAATSAQTTSDARRAGATALITDDLDESMLLAVAGVRLDDSPETRSSLLAALGQHPEVIASTELSGEEVLHFDVSPDGDHGRDVRPHEPRPAVRPRVGRTVGRVPGRRSGATELDLRQGALQPGRLGHRCHCRGPDATSCGAPRPEHPGAARGAAPRGRMVSLAGQRDPLQSGRNPLGRLHVARSRSRRRHPAGRDVGLRVGPLRPGATGRREAGALRRHQRGPDNPRRRVLHDSAPDPTRGGQWPLGPGALALGEERRRDSRDEPVRRRAGSVGLALRRRGPRPADGPRAPADGGG